jgi:hypothetical protein
MQYARIDMVNCIKPDERSVMTYVSAYYHAFAGPMMVFINNLRPSALDLCSFLLRACLEHFSAFFFPSALMPHFLFPSP